MKKRQKKTLRCFFTEKKNRDCDKNIFNKKKQNKTKSAVKKQKQIKKIGKQKITKKE